MGTQNTLGDLTNHLFAELERLGDESLTPEEFRGFCKGNVLKYVWRERFKGGDDDLAKAVDYILYATGEADG